VFSSFAKFCYVYLRLVFWKVSLVAALLKRKRSQSFGVFCQLQRGTTFNTALPRYVLVKKQKLRPFISELPQYIYNVQREKQYAKQTIIFHNMFLNLHIQNSENEIIHVWNVLEVHERPRTTWLQKHVLHVISSLYSPQHEPTNTIDNISSAM